VPQVGGELFLNYQRSGARHFVAATGALTLPGDLDSDAATFNGYWSVTLSGGYVGGALRFPEP